MSDFTSDFWNFYIAGVALVGIIGCALFLWSQGGASFALGKTTGHSWDEDLEEFNNPLPKWWSWLFYITVVFALGYLVYFPGLGSFPGIGKWSSVGQYDEEQKAAAVAYAPLYDQFRGMTVPAIAKDTKAMEMGQRLFRTYCIQCHGTDGGGKLGGFPNLTDNDWLHGGTPERITATISQGWQGVMTPHDYLGADTVRNLAHYVRSLSNQPGVDAARANSGREAWINSDCFTCHGTDAKGNPDMGGPNLTDNIWLYGSDEATVIETITKGRNLEGGTTTNNRMPAWQAFLGDDRIKLLTAYVYSLSNK
ncbi:MAG: cytochrome-c oxidase, cbb3-type subunit III [Zoogloeaceae bacterium]|jgi:cytochrome c oxidase cbb3-type subunit 3|nr:cytochrome-c oxidase, cbb3-type subunit III [Zoogloeaceae bacterium]